MVNVGDIVIAKSESGLNCSPESYYAAGYLIVIDVIIDKSNNKAACCVLNQQGAFSWLSYENLIIIEVKNDN